MNSLLYKEIINPVRILADARASNLVGYFCSLAIIIQASQQYRRAIAILNSQPFFLIQLMI